MAAPLVAREHGDRHDGVWRHAARPPFTPADLSFLISLSQQAAAAIENARLFQEAQAAKEQAEQANRPRAASSRR